MGPSPPSRITSLRRTLNNPSVALLAVLVAIGLGATGAPVLQILRPFGSFYLALLQMFVLPFLLVTVPLSIRSAMCSGSVGPILRTLALWTVAALIVVAAISTLLPTIVFQFVVVDEGLLSRIGAFIGSSSNRVDLEFALDPDRAEALSLATSSMILDIVPSNIFAALANNDSLRVLVFAAVFGIALVVSEQSDEFSVFGALRHIQRVCVLVFDWLSLLVPIGIVALIAPQVAVMGTEILGVVAVFAGAFLAAAALLIGCAIAVISFSLRRSPARVAAALLKPVMLAAATTNTLVCIPLSLKVLQTDLDAPREPCEIFIPIGFAALRFGTMAYFTSATLFMATLAGRHFSPIELTWVALLSTAASFATLGSAGLAALTPLAAVLRSFGLSYELAVPLMIIVDPVANMIRTMVNVAVNCAIPVVAVNRGRQNVGRGLELARPAVLSALHTGD